MLVKIIDGFKGHKKYFFYGCSILFSRGVEYLILFFAPLMLSKQDYGHRSTSLHILIASEAEIGSDVIVFSSSLCWIVRFTPIVIALFYKFVGFYVATTDVSTVCL